MSKITNKKRKSIFLGVCIVLFSVAIIVFECVPIEYNADPLRNEWISRIVCQLFGILATLCLLIAMNTHLFGKPKKLLYLIPAILVAVDNFQFFAYFSGKMQLIRTEAWDVILFFLYCLGVGVFEEFIFRGGVFALLADVFPDNKKGLLYTFFLSSLIFGFSHLLNLLMGANIGGTLLQIGYSILTGGLFAFVLLKTKNVLCCAFIHALYNFCGTLMETPANLGLGSGVVLDLGTGITMAIIGTVVGLFVLYSVFTYSENERIELYKRLGIKK